MFSLQLLKHHAVWLKDLSKVRTTLSFEDSERTFLFLGRHLEFVKPRRMNPRKARDDINRSALN